MRATSVVAGGMVASIVACVFVACATKEPTPSTYYDRTIAPILQSTCVRTNTGAGCHVADAKGNAFGNLDLTTFDGVDRRRDLLLDYGPYLKPSLLVKNVPPYQVTVQLWDGTTVPVTTDIKHTGLSIFDPTGSAYETVHRWIENGATEQNTGVPPVDIPRKPCTDTIPQVAGFDPTTDPTRADYAVFLQSAAPILASSCVAGNCHGTAVNALYLTCGTSPAEQRWNYHAASQYLATNAAQSEVVRRPLASSVGGSYHEGGPIFASVMDSGYQGLLAWAQAFAAAGPPPEWGTLDPAFLFFAQKVQPVLVKKGCMMAQCHSAAMFHDYRLRGGSAGSFSLATSMKNYAFSVEQMSFESDDVNASRLVRKNLYRPELYAGSNGIAHRGGPLFEDFGGADAGGGLATGAVCDQVAYDYDAGNVDTIPGYCIVREWHRRERMERNLAPISAIVYVARPPPAGPDRPQDFDVYAGGASLHIATVTQAPGGALTLGTDARVDLSTCSGLAADVDVRRPAVSWDGTTIAFAARSSATNPLVIYTIAADGTGCTPDPVIGNHDPSGNGLLEHDFDPAFSPPGPDGNQRIVFASTRGNLDPSPFSYSGPQRTPEDLSKPNADLYVLEPDPAAAGTNRIRQLTWQLNMERMPSFMQDGRLIFTVEKREPNFYQLALRRQNLDGGDYHPLYAQRDSIGYSQATYAAELSHKDFVTIFSNANAQHGAGSLAVFNRSIGVDFSSADPSAYPVDPSVLDADSGTSLESDFFLHSLRVVATDGSYTSPSPLPDGQVLVSFGAGDPSTFGGDYDLYVLDPTTGNKTKLLGDAGTAEVEAVAVYARAPKGIFTSVPDEPNGHTQIQTGTTAADVTVLDMTVLASLLFQNTPTGRVVEPDLPSFEIYEDLPPDVSAADCGANATTDPFGQVCVRRRLVGSVPVLGDGSAHFRIPGGMPFLLHLADDAESRMMTLPRWQREEMTFTPGEYAHQSFPSVFFNNLCGGCHGAISGRPVDAALKPDFLTQASNVSASVAPATDLTGGPGTRGAVIGAPATP
ncbi:MAG TPA: hypothetical protein VGM06_16090 [Polyangiaceae bacterium]